MNNIYPKVKLATALAECAGNQSELARSIGYTRAYINELVRKDLTYLPEAAAWRFVDKYGPEARLKILSQRLHPPGD